MKRLFPSLVLTALAAFALAGPAGATQSRPLSDFDVRKVTGLADKLALCDLTAFLNTDPPLNADVIVTPDRGDSRTRVLRHPYFRPMVGLYDEDFDRLLRRLQTRKAITGHEVAVARTRYDAEMLHSFDHSTMAERAFVYRQYRLCGQMIPALEAG